MDDPISFGKIDLNIVSSLEKASAEVEEDTPFRIAVLGDFSGRRSRGICEPLKGRRFFEVDRDNFDDVLAKIAPSVNFRVADNDSGIISIGFAELEDFHPDRLYEKLDIFRSLKEARKKLNDPKTFGPAADEIRRWSGSYQKDDSAPAQPPSPSAGGSLLDQMIEQSEGRPLQERRSPSGSDMERFVSSVARPYSIPKEDARKDEFIGAVDEITSALMQLVLHSSAFQGLEAAWRGLYFLINRLETGETLRVSLLDVSLDELSADLSGVDDLSSSGLFKLLVEQTVGTSGGDPWALLAGNYEFEKSQEHAALLGRIAKIAAAAGAPFVAGASPVMLGCRSLAGTPDPDDWTISSSKEADAAWKALRHLPEAAYLGLALPRFILRLPYGAGTEEIDRFEFEEMGDDHRHEDYLWGNAVFVAALLMGEAFSSKGWDFEPGQIQDVEDLPVHVYKKDGESFLTPAAEVNMTERAAGIILGKGLVPLLSIKGTDRIRVARFQSISEPPAPLSGRWAL